MIIIISSRLKEVALPIVVGAEKHMLLNCLTGVVVLFSYINHEQ